MTNCTYCGLGIHGGCLKYSEWEKSNCDCKCEGDSNYQINDILSTNEGPDIKREATFST